MPKEPSRLPDPLPPASLKPAVRRQIGQSLRGLYAETLSAPMGQRLTDLVAQIEKLDR
ncbi:hypothetical protein [Methylobacterium gregans]|uniref:Anti-sigma factor NepR domain-containing protein n=1 Tax=Methylobacterium gregans TaxID=374424 RepID=A0AA37MIY3_9HYPH|nr:hypothetical protein [Methylobacterium gregans]MDQ0524291.1 hypothetical protein [Methylobacterium gregans]GJD81991.1 hypothetical protein NBEOAGPD_5249 [Methylobacterium gregans]GLS57213.1 hypothetical protein GCM10007886_53990 [Methylobacterium gregans]